MMHDDEEGDSFAGVSHDPSVVMAAMIKLDVSYIANTWIGRVKLLQFIFCILAGCILPSSIPFFFTRFSFYTFVIWTCFMYIFVDLLLHVTSLSKLMPDFCRTSDIMMYPLFIGALALLISCSLVASVANLYVGTFASSSRTTRTGFSAAFGFILMILFLVEAFLHFRRARGMGGEEGDGFTARGRRAGSVDSDYENGNMPPRGGRNIVISRPVIQKSDSPPPYHDYKENDGGSGGGGGVAVPLGSYGDGAQVDY